MKWQFDPWRAMTTELDRMEITKFLRRVRDDGVNRFRRGVKSPPKSGRIYRRAGGSHQASINLSKKEYPANETGALAASINGTVTSWSVTIGSNAPHSGYLADGTAKMQPRKMSREALQDTVPAQLARFGRWAKFK